MRVTLLALALALGGCGPGSQQALDEASVKLRAAPKSPEAWVAYARQLQASGREEDALDAFSAAFDYRSKDVEAYRQAARLAGSFGMFTEARLWADLGMRWAPGDPECNLLAARALVSAQKRRKAERYLKALGRGDVPPFQVPRDKALLAKLKYDAPGNVFVVRTDVGSRMARLVSSTAERIFARYQQLLPGLRPPTYKMRIFLFNEKDDYARMIDRYMGRGVAESEGLTVKDPMAIRVILSMESDESYEGRIRGTEWVNRVLLHEINHVAMYLLTGGRMPLWFAEGFAEYTAGANPSTSGFRVGGVLRMRADAIKYLQRQGYSFPSLGRLMGGAGVQGLYAYAWSFVHFLNHGQRGKYRGNWRAFLAKARAGYCSNRTFYSAFEGVDMARLEQEWKSYALSL